MHHFYALEIVIIYAIMHFHVTVTAGTTHAHAPKIYQRVVLRLPGEARVSTAAVRLQKNALWVFLHSAFTRPTAKLNA